MFSNFFPPENRAIYEIMSKNMEPERPQMTIWLYAACWINKATRTQADASARATSPTPTHARTHSSMRPPPHTHTEIRNTYCFSLE